jgi:hypothetical protein
VVVIEEGVVSEEGRYDVLVSVQLPGVGECRADMSSRVEKEVDSGH